MLKLLLSSSYRSYVKDFAKRASILILSRVNGATFAGMESSGNHTKSLVAICQFTANTDKERNFQTCKELVEKASSRGATMVFLPECYDFMAESKEQLYDLAESIDDDLVKRYRKMAKDLSVWLSLGGGHEKSEEDSNRVYNSHVVIDSSGCIESIYRKTHLFEVNLPGKVQLKEVDFTVPGRFINSPVQTPVGKIGLGTCYDVRFPEFSLALIKMGAEILTFPSAFTQTTGSAHWEVLLRARAIENQAYVIAAAQTGRHNSKRVSYGHAMIVDPWGRIMAECKEGTEVAFAEIDTSYVKDVRSQVPMLCNRRTDLYPSIYAKQTKPADACCFDVGTEYQFGQVSLSGDQLFYLTELSMAFVNLKPFLQGHVLVSPLRAARRFEDLKDDEISDLFKVVQAVQKVVENHYGAKSSTIAIQDGIDAGQTIEHIHVHVLPRHPNDLKFNDDIYQQLQDNDKDENRKSRSKQEMADEASMLRQIIYSSANS